MNSVPLVREKFSRLLTISDARKVCCVILSSSAAFCGSPLQLLGQHLRIRRDHSQRRIDFMRHACGQQANGRKFVGLGKLRLPVRSAR